MIFRYGQGKGSRYQDTQWSLDSSGLMAGELQSTEHSWRQGEKGPHSKHYQVKGTSPRANRERVSFSSIYNPSEQQIGS